jgi:hypothetical protein
LRNEPDPSYAGLLTGVGLKQLAIFIVLTPLAMPISGVRAEPTKLDLGIAEMAKKDPTSGLIFMEVKLFDGKMLKNCDEVRVAVISDGGNTASFPVRLSPMFFGYAAEGSVWGGSQVLAAGIYEVTEVWCKGGQIRLGGKFARFALRAGQVSNLGCLVIDYTRGPYVPSILGGSTLTARTRVEDMGTDARASLTKLAPVAFSKATKRHMVPNPATSKPAQ